MKQKTTPFFDLFKPFNFTKNQNFNKFENFALFFQRTISQKNVTLRFNTKIEILTTLKSYHLFSFFFFCLFFFLSFLGDSFRGGFHKKSTPNYAKIGKLCFKYQFFSMDKITKNVRLRILMSKKINLFTNSLITTHETKNNPLF